MLQQVTIAGPTLAVLLQSVLSNDGPCDGLLFGTLARTTLYPGCCSSCYVDKRISTAVQVPAS
jgi:hypothetical protein